MARGDWIILRTAPNRTAALADELVRAGYSAWTPVLTVEKVKDGKRVEVGVCLTPSFVFADNGAAMDLLRLTRLPAQTYREWDSEQRRMVTRGIPLFRLFRHMGEIAAIPDRQLDALRERVARSIPKPLPPLVEPLEKAERVLLKDAGFEGLWATVETSDKKMTRVLVDGWILPVDLPTWTLRKPVDNVPENNLHQSQQALTAKAA